MNKASGTPGPISVDDNQESIDIDIVKVGRLAKYVLIAEKASARGELSITFVDSAEMARLNLLYRHKEGPTDVLSFLMDQGAGDGFITPVPLLGNIVICPEVAAANAADEGGDTHDEINLLVAHGLLHLLGYGHSTKKDKIAMFNRQTDLAREFKERGENEE